MQVVKRDGTLVEFDKQKIVNAITKANEGVDDSAKISPFLIIAIAEEIEAKCVSLSESPTVESIQDMVENCLMRYDAAVVAKAYIKYRYTRSLVRESNTTDQSIKELIEGTNDYWNTENSNKNAKIVTTQRDYIAGITSTDIARRFIFSQDVVDAHDNGLIHIHDMDYAAQMALTNCCLVNLDDMLQNGTNVNSVQISKPKSFQVAITIAAQIITAVSSSQYGGVTITLSHLAPFIRISRDKAIKKYMDRGFSLEDSKKWAEMDLRKEIEDGVQTFNYQVNSMATTNGQAPFISVSMHLNEAPEEYREDLALLIEEFLKQRIKGMPNEKGIYVTQAFPKLLYVLEEDNITETGKYWYLTRLAAECSAKRLVPDYISEKKMLELKGDCYPCMGCRSFLTPDRFSKTDIGNIAKAKNYVPGKNKYWGRFNQGVVTISLPDAALSSGRDEKKFWEIMEERTELCHKALRTRHERIKQITSDCAPILWQHGAFARLGKGEKVEPLLYNGYSTISLGFAGLYECVKYMTGTSHTGDSKEFALKVMRFLNDKCAQWKAAENMDYSLYGSPIESTTYKFAKCLKKRFGDNVFVELDGKDRAYITNSYHVPVFEDIDAFSKLALEAEFQALSPGGAISYIETPNMQQNIDAVLTVIKFIYDHIMYAELNTKSDYCQVCGYDGEIQIYTKDDGKLGWKCPNCGNTDQRRLNVARRTCGYIGTQFWNEGRTEEIKDRVLHL